ncbi:MAG: NYN domain-containing protein, partial [Chloroflexota bacterium]
GKVKANLDIELVVDMMKTARNLDIAIVVSGDGDFAPAIRAVQEQGVRVEVISFRGNTSSDLIEVADLFTDIVQLARVEKGTRSGRRVADDDADLSMTEVPDKQTEGTGVGRGRARGRGRGREAEPVSVAARGRSRVRPEVLEPAAPVTGNGAGLVALPGERLARSAGPLTEADLAQAEVFTLDDLDDVATDAAALAAAGDEPRTEDGEEPRRRRRRGGRGRGRGRGRAEDGQFDEAAEAAEAPPRAAAAEAPPRAAAPAPRSAQIDDEDDDEIPVVPAARGPRTTPFGSVWDSQLGTPSSAATAPRAPLVDEEDFEEPEIPEYLIAEQRRSGNRAAPGGRGGGARGGRSAYQSAMERERFGRGGSGGGGINRYPDVSGRPRPSTAPREDHSYSRGAPRPPVSASPPAPRSSNEPWSDVPPELEALLRAQVAQKPPVGRPSTASRPAPERADLDADTPVVEPVGAAAKPRAARKPRVAATTPAAEPVATKPRATRSSRAATAVPADASSGAEPTAGAGSASKVVKPRATRKPAVAKASTATADLGATPEAADGTAAAGVVAAPKRRATRKTATTETP